MPWPTDARSTPAAHICRRDPLRASFHGGPRPGPLLVRILKMGGPGGGPASRPSRSVLHKMQTWRAWTPTRTPPILRMRTRRGPGPGPLWKPALSPPFSLGGKAYGSPSVRFVCNRRGRCFYRNLFTFLVHAFLSQTFLLLFIALTQCDESSGLQNMKLTW